MRATEALERPAASTEGPAEVGPRRKRRAPRGRIARKEQRAGFLFASPWLLGVILLTVGPILASVVLSTTNWNLISSPRWVGVQNYRDMAGDYNFWQSVRVTLFYTVLAVPLYQVAGLLLALLLNQRVRGMYLFRTILFLPSVLSGVAVAALWVSLLNPDLGVVNDVLRAIGVDDPPRWLTSPHWAVPAIVLMGLWGVGGTSIIYLAGLQNIPPALYNAAKIDGAGAWQQFRNVTLPLLTPTLLFTLLIGLIDAFQVFDTAFVLGGGRGGQGGSLLFYVLNIWNEGFRNGRFGYASALAWVLVVAAALVIVAIFVTSKWWVYYESEDA
jgi:multiple sugar transport system permease protein